MNNVISFTPAQLSTILLGFCGAIVSMSAAAAVISKAWAKLKKPNEDQNKRITCNEDKIEKLDARVAEHDKWVNEVERMKLEQVEFSKRLDKHDEFLENDKNHFRLIDEGNKVTQKALLALLSHAIDGNDVDSLRDAKKALEGWLVNR